MNLLSKTWNICLDVLFPPICLNCRKYLDKQTDRNLICNVCFSSIDIYGLCQPISAKTILACATSYGNKAVKELIHTLKYNGLERAAEPIAEIIVAYVDKIGLLEIIEPENAVIVPVPLHWHKKKQRGFNQSELIARELGKRLNIPVENILKRTRDTKPQIEMVSDKARAENIKNAFAIRPIGYSLLAKHLILIDDVFTSGATALEAAKVLHQLKPKQIIILTATRA